MLSRATPFFTTALLMCSTSAYGDWVANWPEQVLDWQTDQIRRVVAAGSGREGGQLVGVDGKKCLEGSSFRFDVDDRYAFDTDEVQVEVEFYRHAKAAAVEVSYEKNGEAEVQSWTINSRLRPSFPSEHFWNTVDSQIRKPIRP